MVMRIKDSPVILPTADDVRQADRARAVVDGVLLGAPVTLGDWFTERQGQEWYAELVASVGGVLAMEGR